MTIMEFRCECVNWAREHWWNGAGAVVVSFLLAVFIWARPGSDYLLYAALLCVGVHAYISSVSFEKSRADRKHVEEIAVAYREQIKLEEALAHDVATDRISPNGNGGAASHISGPRVRDLVPLSS